MRAFLNKISYLISISALLSITLFLTSAAVSAENEGGPAAIDQETSIINLYDRIDLLFQSIVVVIVYDITGEESARGSGFFYDPEGKIMTNAIILRKAYSAEVVSNNNRYGIVSILHYDEKGDTAVIKVNATNEVPLEIDSKSIVNINDTVLAIGRNDAFRKTLSEGSVESIAQLDGKRELIKGKTVRPKLSLPPSSDGPLLNSEGKVIGITSFNISDSVVMDNKSILFDTGSINAIRIASLSDILESSDTPSLLKPKESRVWWQWFKFRIKKAIISAFIYLYSIGLTKIISFLLLVIVTLSIAHLLFTRIKKKFFKQIS